MHDVCSSVNGDPSPVTAAANSSLNLLRETDCSCGDAVEVVELPVVVKPPVASAPLRSSPHPTRSAVAVTTAMAAAADRRSSDDLVSRQLYLSMAELESAADRSWPTRWILWNALVLSRAVWAVRCGQDYMATAGLTKPEVIRPQT